MSLRQMLDVSGKCEVKMCSMQYKCVECSAVSCPFAGAGTMCNVLCAVCRVQCAACQYGNLAVEIG